MRKVQSSWLFLFFKKHEFIDVKENNYYEYSREYVRKMPP